MSLCYSAQTRHVGSIFPLEDALNDRVSSLSGNMALRDLKLESEIFVPLLSNLVGEAKYLQNNPPEHVPKEDRAARHVLDILSPLSVEEGGPLIVKHVSYVEGRGNIIVEYPGTENGRIVSFVGCHMDVVTANPEDWVSETSIRSF